MNDMERFLFIFWTLLAFVLVHSNCLEQASFYGGSYISVPLKEAKSSTDIHFKFRTRLPNALLLLVAGSTDYCIVQLDNGRLKLSINLGAGESEIISPSNLKLNDFKWHDVVIVRKEANLSLIIDTIHTIKKQLPGKFFELNIHHGLFIGGRGNYSELFFGHTGNLRGCMAEVMYNGILILEQARSRSTQTVVQGVTWNCAAEFEANLDRPISFVEDNAFMAISHPISHTFKFQTELRTTFAHSVLLYNPGPVSKNDLLALEIWKGKVHVTLKYADKSTELSVDEAVSNGHWHTVSVRLTPILLELTVDGATRNAKLPRIGGGGTHIDLVDVFYIGGMEVNKRARAMAKGLKTADTNFKGCMRHVTLGDQKTGLPYAKISEGLLPGCIWQFPCSRSPPPCVEKAACLQQGIDSFSCQCDQQLCVRPNYNESYKVFGRGNLATDLELLSLEPLHVLEGESALILNTNLHLILDYPKYGIRAGGIVFRVVEAPGHGSVRIDAWPQKDHFTLADLSDDRVHYMHDGSEHHRDHVLLEMRFTAGDPFTLPAYLQGNFQFTLAVTVAPVNDAPKLHIASTNVLRVAQGTRQIIDKKLLEAEDPDSPPEQLVYNIVESGPGNFELLTKSDAPANSFTQADVNNHQVLYVQKGGGATKASNASYIHVQVSDGIETSALVRLRVSTFAQYWRLRNNSGLVLMHQTSAYITPYNLSFVSNVPNAIDNGQFNIVQQPQFGRVQVEQQADTTAWDATDSFSSEDLRQHRVRYEHTTGAPDYDEFQFHTTLNKTTLYTFRMTFAKCNFVKISSKPLILNTSREALITSNELQYQTDPVRSATTSITYHITKAPTYGYLFSSVSKYKMKHNDFFMQEDIELKNIKYRLHRKPFSFIHDSFEFKIYAPGCLNLTRNVSIIHYPSPDVKSKVHVTLKPLRVEEGSSAIVDLEHLNIKAEFLSQLTFNVTKSPEHGSLYVDNSTGSRRNRTDYFTLQELQRKQLFYLHDDSETKFDSFSFLAVSSEAENFQYADKLNVNILLKNDNMPTRAIDQVFHVVVGGQRLLTGEDLRYVDADLDTKPADIIYTYREKPNGGLFEADYPSREVTEFSQEQLDNGEILFKHKGPESGKLKLWVTDGQFHVNGLLEVQASAPFVRPTSTKKLVVQFGKSKIIQMEHLSSTTNLYAKHQDIIYEIINKGNYGYIATKDKNKKVLEFTQYEILEENILYVHEGGAGNVDEIGFRVRCRDAVAVTQLGVWILPEVYWDPITIKTVNTLSVEESTSALVSKNVLEVAQLNVPAGALTFYVMENPQAGYLDILNNNNQQTAVQNNVIKSFTQLIVYEKRLLYIQSGANVTSDRIVFNVTNGIVWHNNLVLNIQIIPENLYIGSNNLTVDEGETAPITVKNLFVHTQYYSNRVTDYVIMQQPKYGCVQVQRQCSKMHGFSQKELQAKMVQYAHDGTENLSDEIAFVAVAGQKRSIPITLHITVQPKNDHKPKLVNNTGLRIWEGGTSTISSDMLSAVDADRPLETLRYYILSCWWGHLFLTTDPNTTIQTFTQQQINNDLVAFRHQNGSEAKFTFNISDGMHFTKEHSFLIRAKAVTLNLERNSGLHVFPLQKKFLSVDHLLSIVSDINRTITYDIITPPTLGRLMIESETPGLYKVVKSFTQNNINRRQIFYEHTHSFTGLYANDSFLFNVKSHLAKTLSFQKLTIDISVSSGGLDAYVNIPRIVVDEGGMVSIPLNLSNVVTFLENHAGLRSPVIHSSTKASQHGQVFLSHSSNLTTFTQAQLESGQIHYQHDHSDSLTDNVYFSLYLIPGYIMLCNVTVPIIVNPINDQPFKLVTPAPRIFVIQGENHTILRSEFLTEDADTPPSDIRYDIIRSPAQGSIVLLPDGASVNHFSQADIDGQLLVYIHNSSVLQDDKFDFRVWDGKFRPEYTLFNVIVLPVSLNVSFGLPVYLQQGSNVVSLSPNQFYIETNADRRKVRYTVRKGPYHGVLYVKDKPADAFWQSDLDDDNVMYMQTDMTTSNDTFRVFAGVLSGNATVGAEVEVFIKVQPLMQLGNLTVLTGQSNRLTLHVLDATPLAKLTNSNPEYTIVEGPQFGEIRKIIRSSGERRNVLDTPVQSFNHEEVLGGLMYIVMKDVEVGWGGLQDKLVFILAASIFQPAVGELRITVRSGLLNEIYSTLAGPNDPAGHEGGMHVASPNMTRDYFLIVSMVAGVVILGIAVIIIIKCRNLEISELQKENQCLQPIPLPRPPDRLLTSTPPLKQQIQETYASPISTALPHCKVTPLNCGELDTHTRYPYGVDEQLEDWSNCDSNDPSCPTRNVMLRRNQYWV